MGKLDETIGAWIRRKAEQNADRLALTVEGRHKSYARVHTDSDRLAAGLASLGLAPGDRSCLMMQNSLECIDTWFAMTKAGVVEVPINQAYRGHLLEYLVGQSRSRAVVCDAEYLDRIAEAARSLPNLEHVVINRAEGAQDTGSPEFPGHRTGGAQDTGSPEFPRHGAGGAQDTGTPDFPDHVTVHDLADLYRDAPPPEPDIDYRDTAVILYTSGTTGPSKGVMLSHEANLNLSRHTVDLVGYHADDVLYTAFPLFHINAKYTSVMCAMEADARLIMDRRFSASRFWDRCRVEGITAFNYQGGLLMMLWKQPERPDDVDNPVRNGFGAPCPVDIWERFEERFGVHLTEVYGMTEAAIATENRRGVRRIGTAGRESALYHVAVVDSEDRPVPAGTAGEIVVRPKKPHIMFDRYFDMADATLEAFRNLWFHTGDRGRLDADGYLTFIDRMKDCVRRRGENISSYEVEAVINTCEAVLESAVIGVPSELGEEEVMAVVVLKADHELTETALLDFCVPRMAHFAVPRFVRWVDELPKTPSERVQKFKLREQGITPNTWDRDQAGYIVPR